MTCRVDFYVTSSDSAEARTTLACRVVEKAFQSGKKVYLYCHNEEQMQLMDERLWTFSQSSFVPHEIQGQADELTPVTLGCQSPDSNSGEVVISMAEEPVRAFDHFTRVAEIVGTNDTERQSARERFKFYREHGIEPVTHKI